MPSLRASCVLAGLLAFTWPAFGQATLRITVPPETPTHLAPRVAGTFNGWDPWDDDFILAEQPDGSFAVTLPESVRGPIAFKFTLGGWGTVELSDTFDQIPDRQFTIPASGTAEYTGSVPVWSWWTWPGPSSTATNSVSLMEQEFFMPQVGRYDRVFIYLPPDYDTSGRSYPVLYAHDANFMFDRSLIPQFGEARLDESLDSLHAGGDPGVIVVATLFEPGFRLQEYLPWMNADAGGGDGDGYADFLVETLKPYVDAHYRTLTGRETTGIAGGSAGAHISVYAALKYPDVFGRVIALSPAHFINPEIYDYAATAKPNTGGTCFYFVSAELETTDNLFPPDVIYQSQVDMVAALTTAGFDTDRIHTEARDVRPHGWEFMGHEFPAAYDWTLNACSVSTATEEASQPDVHTFDLWPNPGRGLLNVRVADNPENARVELFDLLGRRVDIRSAGIEGIDTADLAPGLYVVRVNGEAKTWVKQ